MLDRDAQPPVRRRLGAGQRELGRAGPRARPGAAAVLVQALYHLTKALDPHPAGDRQRRLGAPVSDILGSPRLHPRGRSCASATAAGRPRPDAGADAALHRSSCCRELSRRTRSCSSPSSAASFDLRPADAGWNGYGAVDSRGVAASYRDLVGALLRSPVVAGFCYTQLTDTAQERNGLLTRTACRRRLSRRSARSSVERRPPCRATRSTSSPTVTTGPAELRAFRIPDPSRSALRQPVRDRVLSTKDRADAMAMCMSRYSRCPAGHRKIASCGDQKVCAVLGIVQGWP